MSKYYKKKVKQVNDITIKVSAVADLNMRIMDRIEEQEKIVAALQKKLKSWWATQTDKRFILVVEYGNLNKHMNTLNYRVDLTQLQMDNETIDIFKRGAETIIKGFLNDYGKDI